MVRADHCTITDTNLRHLLSFLGRDTRKLSEISFILPSVS